MHLYNKYTFIDICTTIHVLVIYSIGEGVTYKRRAHTYLFFVVQVYTFLINCDILLKFVSEKCSI